MAMEREERRRAYVEKARYELDSLVRAGLNMSGNAFSSILFLKGDLSEDEKNGAPLLGGIDGKALRASCAALGYAPEDWVALSTLADGGERVAPDLLRQAIAALDPATVCACDEAATASLRDAFADELVDIEDFATAMLQPGYVARVQGMRMMNLGGFAAALDDKGQKQLMWARLKQLPPLAEPY